MLCGERAWSASTSSSSSKSYGGASSGSRSVAAYRRARNGSNLGMDEGCHGGPDVHDTDRIARRNPPVMPFCHDVGVFLMRVTLPDRPGSLGAVATAMGGVGGDINAVEIVEKGSGVVVDDFIVDLPPYPLPETIVTACQTLEGVRVEWIARYPEGGGLQSDLEALERMAADPTHAAETLVSLCPVVFRSHWASLLDVSDGAHRPSFSTTLGPDLTPEVAVNLHRSTPPTALIWRRSGAPDGVT